MNAIPLYMVFDKPECQPIACVVHVITKDKQWKQVKYRPWKDDGKIYTYKADKRTARGVEFITP